MRAGLPTLMSFKLSWIFLASRLSLPKMLKKYHSNYSITTTTPPNVTRTVQNDTSAELSLEIPLDRVSINQSRLKSAITLGNAQITLRTAKTQLLNNVTSSVENLQSQWAQLLADEANYKLALQNNEAAQIKYQYGKIDAFSLSQQQQQLQQSANTLINDRISYLEQVITYEKLVGTLLPQWHIHLQGIENATSA
ncbi:MAG: TolC family protein [Gammaproteobacteria bacterium]|nr:TolC family protein [Gammaproteobacteria bacterium]